jgi:hypothetical protein
MRRPGVHPLVPTTAGFGVAALLALAAAGCSRPEIVTGEATLSSSAGTVDVQCNRSKVRIVGSAPEPGFTARMIVAGPSGQASLVFENPDANDFRVAVHCVDTRPRLDEFEIEDTSLADGE